MRVAILIGLQASGKTSFHREHLAGTHDHVSKDNFPKARNRQKRQLRLIDEALTAGRSVAVDNTNPSPAEWAPLIALAHSFGAPAVAYWFPVDVEASIARNAARADPVPDVGLFTTLRLIRQPTLADGFDEVYSVTINATGGFDVTQDTQAREERPAGDTTQT
ncbi:kinase [Actinosynnema sp. ALI-1.44]|uniref:ATP-binding protein n=1 Tax=Actinosynnema sp. ALI-1.44 TaxID=1933779 RepID=UPI00097BB111|nr:ATP-binding protein [Actinosynnema sp. ALI-1.44]ONI77033.1 kinase [Actinosynnema sp. ALI-1.44]